MSLLSIVRLLEISRKKINPIFVCPMNNGRILKLGHIHFSIHPDVQQVKEAVCSAR